MPIDVNVSIETKKNKPADEVLVKALRIVLLRDAAKSKNNIDIAKSNDIENINKWLKTCSNKLRNNLKTITVSYSPGKKQPAIDTEKYQVEAKTGFVKNEKLEKQKQEIEQKKELEQKEIKENKQQAVDNLAKLRARFHEDDFVKIENDQTLINELTRQLAKDNTTLESSFDNIGSQTKKRLEKVFIFKNKAGDMIRVSIQKHKIAYNIDYNNKADNDGSATLALTDLAEKDFKGESFMKLFESLSPKTVAAK